MKYFFIILLLLSSWMGYGNPPTPQAEDECKKHNFCQLVCQTPPKDALTGKLIDPLNPIFRDSFSPREAVWVAIDANIFRSEKDGARIYVIQHKDDNLSDGNKLEEVKVFYKGINLPPGSEGLIYIQVWKCPEVREEGYDVAVDLPPLGIYNKGTDIVDGIAQAAFVVPEHWIYLESIFFNYDRNCHCWDAINIRRNGCQEVRVPEWVRGQSYPAAYIKKRIRKIKVTFLAASSIKKAFIGAVKKNDVLIGVGRKNVDFKKFENSNNIKRGEAIFEVIDRTPGEIRKEYQQWQWYCKKIILNDDNNLSYPRLYIGDSMNKIFIILSAPQSPWCHDGEHALWTDVLDFSCEWADGAMTPKEAATKICKHLYNDLGGSYSQGASYTNNLTEPFDLTRFMYNIASSKSIGEVNCTDMGKALVIFSNAIGCGLSYWETPRDARNPITFNNIERIGGNMVDIYSYKYHGLAGIHGRVITVFDASFRKYYGCKSAEWLANISWLEYQNKVIQSCDKRDIHPYQFNIKACLKKNL